MVRMAGFSGNSPKKSRSRKRLNLLENCQDGRRRTGRESSKRVHDGEPLEIDVLILYFCGRPQFNTRTNSNLLYRKGFHSTRFRAIFVSDRFIYHRSSLRDYKETMRP